MKPDRKNKINIEKPISRVSFLTLLDLALKHKSYRFSRQAAQKWLAIYPGDLGVGLRLGKTLFAEGNRREALVILEKLVRTDPEFLAGQEALAFAYNDGVSETYVNAMGSVYALGGDVPTGIILPRWSQILREVRQDLEDNQLSAAGKLLKQVVGNGSITQLVDIIHLLYLWKNQDTDEVMQHANLYHVRWPECLQAKLCLAEARLGLGDETGAVNLLHQCVISDATGQVVSRLWGNQHRYQQLWPERLELKLGMPIPASVAADMGINQLPSIVYSEELVGQEEMKAKDQGKAAKELISESNNFELKNVESLQSEREILEDNDANSDHARGLREEHDDTGTFDKIEQLIRTPLDADLISIGERLGSLSNSLSQPQLTQGDSRFPMYVILSTRSGLVQKYGPQTADVLVEEMTRLQNTVRQHHGWGACVFLPDDLDSCKSHGVDPVSATDPWKIKLSLADLDKTLSKKGAMIGALLIVGGPEIVPYHHLPNPTDDMDVDVPSDNPYSTLDSNYFVPEFPVGRFPGESEPDAGLLLEQLRNAENYHSGRVQNKPWWAGLVFPIDVIIDMLSKIFNPKISKQMFTSSGCTAAIWQRASIAVFRPIGQPGSLLISPPNQAGSFNAQKFVNSSLGYFNLHGIEDGENWYGQRDFEDSTEGPDYPVALRPNDLSKNGHSPETIFSEACYGGHVTGKKIDEAISLKFISIGTRSVIGSTCISYGSVMAPLIGADFLGYIFWKRMREGDTVGTALMRAKVEMVREMNKRQGFLDGEDQKTLLSFVLFGDPLMGIPAVNQHLKGIKRDLGDRHVKTICDNQIEINDTHKISSEKISEVKQMLKDYLPGLENADVHSSKQYTVNGEKIPSGFQQAGKCRPPIQDTGNVVVTVSKQYQVAQQTHHHYARVTLDPKGKMVKLALSR